LQQVLVLASVMLRWRASVVIRVPGERGSRYLHCVRPSHGVVLNMTGRRYME
jgi:hypothetical protein